MKVFTLLVKPFWGNTKNWENKKYIDLFSIKLFELSGLLRVKNPVKIYW